MDIKDILESLTEEDIISIMNNLGAELSDKSNSTNLIFNTICHNEGEGSFKLYYFIENKRFHCFSNCGKIGNLLDLIVHIKGYDIKDGINEIKDFFNMSNEIIPKIGFKPKRIYNKPKLEDIEIEVLDIPPKPYIHTLCKSIRIKQWEEEFITYDTIKKFDIRYDYDNNAIVIPHLDKDDRIVGIRVRNLDEELREKYGKYCPYYKDGITYSHPLGKNLYGLNVSKESIKKYKKVQIFESEKGVLQSYSYFGNNSIAVSTCGSSLSLTQIKLLLDLEVCEFIFCMDKQYKDDIEEEIWLNKVVKMSSELISRGIKVTALWDKLESNLLCYKDAPSDRGIETFLKLSKNRIEIEGD